MNTKQNGTIQIDVDELWTILKYFGFDQKSSDQVYLSSIPRMLDLFDQFNFKATFFIVGKDAQNPKKIKTLKQMIKRGHELANHSLSHIKGLSNESFRAKEKEILEADKILSDISGKKICGFRAPGYSVDEEILDILEENGYLYDSSVFPSFLRTLISKVEQKKEEGFAYGGFKNSMAPLSVYRPLEGKLWKRGNRRLVEIPVTTIPFLRIPFHMAYVYASHTKLFDIGFFLTRKFAPTFNYVLHGIELVDELNDLRFPQEFKVNVPITKRMEIYKRIFSKISKYNNIMTSEDLVRSSTHFSIAQQSHN
tara:strand:+ start:178 stop:1104 length:927 start_codon:yes stop_codon:yes gene_type:complete